jgi:tetratricopeptide (TPR) repeat protein
MGCVARVVFPCFLGALFAGCKPGMDDPPPDPATIEACRRKLAAQVAPADARPPDPPTAHGYLQRGLARFDAKDLDGALLDLNEAVTLNPSLTDGFLHRADTLVDMGDSQCAALDFGRVIREGLPNSRQDAYIRRGLLRSGAGDADGALADLDRAVDVGPNRTDALYFRGLLRGDRENYAGAIADFDRAIELSPKDSDAYG